MNLRTQRADFVFVNTRLGLMHEKIHCHFVAVRMAQRMQQPCLGTASIQGTENVQHAAGAGTRHWHGRKLDATRGGAKLCQEERDSRANVNGADEQSFRWAKGSGGAVR